VGWAAAAGRLGAVAGPALGGYLLNERFAISFSFMVFAIPGVVAAVAVLLISRSGKALASDAQTLAAPAE
jgi:AAHS family benzoate transporter-like MFS transporter